MFLNLASKRSNILAVSLARLTSQSKAAALATVQSSSASISSFHHQQQLSSKLSTFSINSNRQYCSLPLKSLDKSSKRRFTLILGRSSNCESGIDNTSFGSGLGPGRRRRLFENSAATQYQYQSLQQQKQQRREMSTTSVNCKLVKSFDNIVKSSQDQRLYRGLLLDNGLKCLLISDPHTDRSAASVDVNTGHMLDPHEFLGLAHFCEHMLFMGSKKVSPS